MRIINLLNIRIFIILFFLSSGEDCFASSQNGNQMIVADSIMKSDIGENECVTVQKDESDVYVYPFSPQKVIIPIAVFAAALTGTYLLGGLKNYIRDNLSWHKYGDKTIVDDYLQYSTAAGYIGIGFLPGVKTKCLFKERLMAGVTAYTVMTIAVNAMKYSFRHPRPGGGSRNSFPSGHTATVFTGAELMRIEYGNYIGIAGYALGVAVGTLRIYNDRHWITDVIGGAAIGVLSARIGYWMVPWEQKLFGIDRKKKSDSSLSVLPMLGDTNGLLFSFSF